MNTMTNIIYEIAQKLRVAYPDSQTAHECAWHLLEKATGMSKLALITTQNLELSSHQITLLDTWIHDIIMHHKPIQYILGSVPFLDLTITVKPPILIPRPETEEWCNLFIQKIVAAHGRNAKLTILDLCTGSGCIALAIAHALPESTLYAVDISNQALELAQENAQSNNLSHVIFTTSDLFEKVPLIHFDYIVTNPPYIRPQEYDDLDPSVRLWEDKQALIAEYDGLAIIKRIAQTASTYLPHKHDEHADVCPLWIEIGFQQAAEAALLLHKAGFKSHIINDVSGKNRVICARKA